MTTIGGGFKAIWYSLKAAKSVGFQKMFQSVSSKNTCKTCALGMGSQKGGMIDEGAHFPEICKKSFQAQLTDLQDAIPSDVKSMLRGGSSIASEYLQVHIGGDIALLKGIAKAVVEAGKHGTTFQGPTSHHFRNGYHGLHEGFRKRRD